MQGSSYLVIKLAQFSNALSFFCVGYRHLHGLRLDSDRFSEFVQRFKKYWCAGLSNQSPQLVTLRLLTQLFDSSHIVESTWNFQVFLFL